MAADLKKQQEAQQTSFEDIQKELKNLQKKNEQLERPNPFKNPEKEAKTIQQQQPVFLHISTVTRRTVRSARPERCSHPSTTAPFRYA